MNSLIGRIFISLTLAACSAFAQPPVTASDAQALDAVTLPAYVAAGGAYNQLAGANLWGSAIIPVANKIGLYESTTADLFPVKVQINGKAAYVFQSSLREGLHKVAFQDSRNMVLIGADGGYSFSTASSAGSAVSGVSAAFTVTYVRHLSASWALMMPVRALYMPTLAGGAWNPILEIGVCWKPGGGK